ncbi:hypothetical protein, partial [Algoriella sp.]|uniref:hypothetical protein n=1 Tax=Algoriella sp. TaxID=1872434 RepID=UPI002FCBB7AD
QLNGGTLMFDVSKLNIYDDVWTAIENKENYFSKELHKEINRKHILYGIGTKELGCREDCDDVLFMLLDGSEKYAVVHLTWSSKEEKNSSYPISRIYDNLTDLINAEGC